MNRFARRVAPFDPDLRWLAAVLPRSTIGPRTLPLMRRVGHRQQGRALPGVVIERAGRVSVRIHDTAPRPAATRPALLWIHGGGYVMGTAAQDDRLCQLVAREIGALVAAVDYRFAPEHPFPVPLEDCYDALIWLAERNDVDESRIAIGGASAGGGLAAALALAARDRDQLAPVLQLLSYPMLDDRTAARTDLDDRDARLWNNRCNRFGWTAYLGTEPGSEDVSHLAAPARCQDLSGLPAAWIGVGTADILHDEAVAYGRRLQAAGTPCQIHEFAGAFHGFDSVAPKAAITKQYRHAQLTVLQNALRSPKGQR